MRMFLEIVSPGKQGLPADDLPHQKAPKSVERLSAGGVLFKDKMAQSVLLEGAETLQSRYTAKWSESSPLAAISSGHSYAGTPAPTDTLARMTVSAFELDHHNVANGAARLRNLLSWLAFCTQPWTKLGQPPLLKLAFGFFEGYGYLSDFDPTVTEWLPDGKTTSGLPYEAQFTLSFKREPLGPQALEPKKGLPSSQGAPGGAGGLGAGKVNMPTQAAQTVTQAKGAAQGVVSGAAGAVSGLQKLLPSGGR